MLSLQADPRLHHGQYQNQQPPPLPSSSQKQLNLVPYGDEVMALHSNVAASASSSVNVIKQPQPLDSRKAHVIGWWGKALLLRNHPLLWVLSIGFEMMELTFHHMLPNFNECWWDNIVLDILICNWFGIWAGMHIVRYFDGKTYKWVGISRQPNIIGKVKRTLEQFTAAQWDKDEWHPLLGPWRFIQVISLCIVFLTVELNTFSLKFYLWIPPRNPVIVYRLILWWLIAIPTICEYNSYLQDSTGASSSLGTHQRT